MNNGYIKLFRSLLDSRVFASEKALKIWVWLLLKVTFEKRFVSLKVGKGTTVVELLPGELIFGRFQAEETLCIDGSTIYKKLKEFEVEEMITIKSNSHYSVISICNWETYQGLNNDEVTANEQPSNKQVTTKEQPSNTNKKDKNIKELKESKEINISFDFFWNLYPVERHTKKSLCIDYWKKLTDEKRQFIIDNLKNYISSASEVKYLKQTYYFFKEKKYDDDNFVIQKTKEQIKADKLEWARQQGASMPTYQDMERGVK